MLDSPTLSTVNPNTSNDMPSRAEAEAKFVEQAEIARIALQKFIAVKDFDDEDSFKRATMLKLIDATVCSFFLSLIFLSLTTNFLGRF
jgi:hypothetical protein